MSQGINQGTEVCSLADIVPNSGRAALVEGRQIAIFRINTDKGEQFFALDNYCPFSKANVLSRGIVGSLKGKCVVASPIYKQHFCLDSGICLEDDSVSVQAWPVLQEGGKLFVLTKNSRAA